MPIEITQVPSEYKIEWLVWKKPYQRIIGTWIDLND